VAAVYFFYHLNILLDLQKVTFFANVNDLEEWL
jgi:hypothetical protein